MEATRCISLYQTGPCLNPLSSPAPLGLPSQVLQLPAAEVVSRYRAYYDNKLVVSTEPGTFWANEAEKAAYRGAPRRL